MSAPVQDLIDLRAPVGSVIVGRVLRQPEKRPPCIHRAPTAGESVGVWNDAMDLYLDLIAATDVRDVGGDGEFVVVCEVGEVMVPAPASSRTDGIENDVIVWPARETQPLLALGGDRYQPVFRPLNGRIEGVERRRQMGIGHWSSLGPVKSIVQSRSRLDNGSRPFEDAAGRRLWERCYGRGMFFIAAAIRVFISAGGTSSLWVAMAHRLPHLSLRTA